MFNRRKPWAVAVIMAMALFSTGLDAAPHTKAATVARVGHTSITATDLHILARQRGLSKPTRKQRQQLIDSLVDRQLLAQKAIADNVDQQPRVKALIASARNTILASEAAKRYIARHPITDQQLHKRYHTQVADLPSKQYKLAVIVARTRSSADGIEKQLNKGGTFAQIANQQSALSAKKVPGGDLGWAFARNFIPPVAKAIRTTSKGQTAAPVWTPHGWWIVRVDNIRATQHRPFAQAKKALRQQLVQKRLHDYIQQLRAHAHVHVADAKGH